MEILQISSIASNFDRHLIIQDLVYASLTTIGRTGKPEDVAKVVAFSASNDGEYITRSYIPVNGGLVMGGG